MYYIRKLDENMSSISNSLHTVIVKKTIKNYVYISAIGYGGGGVFEEFCGKFIYDDDKEGFIGLFSLYHDPEEWEKNSFESEIINEPFELISDGDKAIINQMTDEIWNEYLIYDEDSETRIIRENYINKMTDEITNSDDWDTDVVDLVSNSFWWLTLSFDW